MIVAIEVKTAAAASQPSPLEVPITTESSKITPIKTVDKEVYKDKSEPSSGSSMQVYTYNIKID
jgi:hypothetical protein